MSEEISEQSEAPADPPPPPPVYFALHNVSRHVAHRTHRAAAAAHPRKKHYLGSGAVRLLPARPTLITEQMLHKHLDEIKQKVEQHVLEVRTVDGRLVDLKTLEAGPLPPAVLLPHPKLDSVADDKPIGQYIPPYVGEDNSMPEVLPPGQKPALLETAAAELEQEEQAKEQEPAAAETAVTSDAELDAALTAAAEAAEAEEESDAPAPSAPEEVSSGESQTARRGRRNRR